MIGGPVHGLAAQLHGLGTVTPCSWSTDQDPSKTNQRRLSSGNTDNGAVRRMRTRIGLLAQPEPMRSIIGATQ